MTDGMSTGALLRHFQDAYAETQAALAASQRDLTAMTAERDELRTRLHGAQVAERVAKNGRDEKRRDAIRERDLARAELASARQELEQLRAAGPPAPAWSVAIAYVHDCGNCNRAIERGHAFTPLLGASGYFRHVHCPTQETP